MGYVVPDEVDPDNLDDRIVPGMYQILIQKADGRGEKSIVVDYEVVNGTNSEMFGKVGKEFLPQKATGAKRVILFACAAGLTSLAKMSENKKNGVANEFDWDQVAGKSIIVEIVKNGDRSSWSYSGTYSLEDPHVASVPKTARDKLPGQGGAGKTETIPF